MSLTNEEIQRKRHKTFLMKNGSLADNNIVAIKFWHPTKNGDLTPYDVLSAEKREVWWYCSVCDTEWQATILSRHQATNCPYCCGQKVKTGFNDFATINPDIADEWMYNKNSMDINPTLVTANSHKSGWWCCKHCGNEYISTFENRNNGEHCKKCGYKKVGLQVTQRALDSNRSLLDCNKELANQWHPTKNGDLTPDMVAYKSRSKVWWLCPEGHEWSAVINSRAEGNGCPECARIATESSFQKAVRTYITDTYIYSLTHEYGCSIIPYNQESKHYMPFDNDLQINNDVHLIIEVHGQQHYEITSYARYAAERQNISIKEALQQQQKRDIYKKEYALSIPGYYYLEISYKAILDNSFKSLIDSEIHKILSLTQQND